MGSILFSNTMLIVKAEKAMLVEVFPTENIGGEIYSCYFFPVVSGGLMTSPTLLENQILQLYQHNNAVLKHILWDWLI